MCIYICIYHIYMYVICIHIYHIYIYIYIHAVRFHNFKGILQYVIVLKFIKICKKTGSRLLGRCMLI